MGEHCAEPPDGNGRGAGGEAARGSPGAAARDAGIPGSAQRAIGAPPRAQAPFEPPRRADRPAAAAVPRTVHARLELGDDHAGTYMRDAIERGGYREALEYYGSDEAKRSETPWHRLRARGWLLGRLGLYDRMGGWLEEASEWDDFDHILAAAGSGRPAAYREPALWMQTPRPVPRSADHQITLEPAAATCSDAGAVPGHVWTAMLILDAAGPICSHVGLGAAAFLVWAGDATQGRGQGRGARRYDPRRGARLHGAPEGCHRWIIADIDFDPRPVNKPHYYYDLTDEGRAALVAARAAGAPWPKAADVAASGLGGATLPDLLESACKFCGPLPDLGKTAGELERLADAWDAQEGGRAAPSVSAEDKALVDLGAATRWPDAGDSLGSQMDHLLYLMTVVDSASSIARNAEPSTRAEGAVLRALIGAIQGLCRRHARAVATEAPPAGIQAAAHARGGLSGQSGDVWRRRPSYADATPALISDLYYCLAEYCRSRRLAADPRSLPLSEALTRDQRASVIEALEKDSPFRRGADRQGPDG